MADPRISQHAEKTVTPTEPKVSEAKAKALRELEEADAPKKTYRVGPLGHYRLGRLYEHGELITIKASEKPGRDWVEEKA